MRSTMTAVGLLALTVGPFAQGGVEPIAVESRVVSAGMFKNGLAVIRREVKIAGPGTYEVLDVPDPVHGTFWIESDAVVTTRVTTREVEMAAGASAGWDVQRELAGSEVVIELKESGKAPIAGRMVDFSEGQESDRHWDRTYETDAYGRPWSDWRGTNWNASFSAAASPARFIVLQTGNGRAYVDAASIASIEVSGAPKAPTQRRSVLEFTVTAVGPGAARESTIIVTYLAKGLTWAPAYRIDMTGSTSLRLDQQAVIRNELEDLRDVELQLISGYPSVEFSHVTSPLSPRTSLAAFFRQLSQDSDQFRSGPVSQQMVMGNVYVDPNQGVELGAPPVGEGVDLHYQSIGRHTLNAGDSLMLTVAGADAGYERVVEWQIPDSRDEYGNRVSEHRRRDEPEKYDDSPWDALQFRNPLPFAMTTAPAMIMDGGRFAGQRTSTWTNAGEETSLRITKALSIRTRNVEREEPEAREMLNIGGRSHRRVTVLGEASASNHRAEAVTLVIRRRFSGELETADQSPRTVLLEEGVYAVNTRNELVWTIELPAGAETLLKYRYTVLVPN